MPTQKIRVDGLKEEDEARAAERLRSLDGVFSAVASHRDGCIEVDFEDDRASFDEMRAALAELGYDAELAG
jgi:copper chaperone CopZ